MPLLRSVPARAALLAIAGLATACAQGSSIEDLSSTSGGDGGSSGEGGRGAGGSTSSDGGASNVGSTTGGNTTGSTSTSGSSTSASSTSSTTGSTTSATTSAGVTTGATTSATTSATSSSSTGGGGDELCDPQDPAPVCGAGQHCIPLEEGVDPICAPAGSGAHYTACFDNAECAPTTECMDPGYFIGSPCCLTYCTGDDDCQDGDFCFSFDPPAFVEGVQYGFCDDGSGFGC